MKLAIINQPPRHYYYDMTNTIQKNTEKKSTTNKDDSTSGVDFFTKMWAGSWIYIKTVVDIVREPVIILDKNLCVLAANESFYRTFQVEMNDTENTLVYKLGNGQWDIPDLRRLLEDILPKNSFFKGFKVTHNFPSIGRKVMILNARQIYYHNDTGSAKVPPIILLAMEDVTEIMDIAESFAGQANELEVKYASRADTIETLLAKLQKDIDELKHMK